MIDVRALAFLVTARDVKVERLNHFYSISHTTPYFHVFVMDKMIRRWSWCPWFSVPGHYIETPKGVILSTDQEPIKELVQAMDEVLKPTAANNDTLKAFDELWSKREALIRNELRL